MSVESREKVFNTLKEMDISYKVTEHPAVYTIEDMEQLNMENIDYVVKNLFLRDDKKANYYLVVMKKEKSADLKEIRNQIGSRRLSFAKEEELNNYLGLTTGEVTPFGVLNDINNVVSVVFDSSLKEVELVGIHPNDNTATVWIQVDDLVKVLRKHGKDIIYADI